MSTGWVAGSVRARALARRRVGAAGARDLATCPGLAPALQVLARSPYGHAVRPNQTLAAAQHAAGEAILWNARVLAGWLPRSGVEAVRLLTAAFELANVDSHLAGLARGTRGTPFEPYHLGALSTAWTRVAPTTDLPAAAAALAASPWRVRGAASRRELALALRLAWADAVIAGVPEAVDWARGGTVLLLSREVLLLRRHLPAATLSRARQVLGAGPVDLLARGEPPRELHAHLPRDARWVLEDVPGVTDLWRAEAAWWHRVENDGFALLRESRPGQGAVVGALAVLGTDLWRVRAALESAARGGSGAALEAFDAVA
ncbi:hypothetical protein [Georgenia satyanarayanai]|uniref:hypothetical protein n=1 Tax=Georgenia satyanarayanai TaxID=860221 RepID=UPI00186AD3D0|nr:hypothetical protein [Georgenia satyanarayanai]